MADCDICGNPLRPDSKKREPDDPVEIEFRYTPTGAQHPVQVLLSMHRRHRTKEVPVTVPVPYARPHERPVWVEGQAVVREARTDLKLVELANDLKAGRLEEGWE